MVESIIKKRIIYILIVLTTSINIYIYFSEIHTSILPKFISASYKDNIKIDCKTEELSWFVPKGVLIHVFYNLITNSIYWIDKRRKYALSDKYYNHEGDDIITIDSPDPNVIVVYDTGTGVMKGMEDILFQPLESGKENNIGRGMGLYIVQQLLRSFSADIWLDSERNQYGNKFKFRIELHIGDN